MQQITRRVYIQPGKPGHYSGRLSLETADGDTVTAHYTCILTAADKVSFTVIDPRGNSYDYPNIELESGTTEQIEEVSETEYLMEELEEEPVVAEEQFEIGDLNESDEYTHFFFFMLGDLVLELIQVQRGNLSTEMSEFKEDIMEKFKLATVSINAVAAEICIEDKNFTIVFNEEIVNNRPLLTIAEETGIDVSLYKQAKYSAYPPCISEIDYMTCCRKSRELLDTNSDKLPYAELFPLLKRILELY